MRLLCCKLATLLPSPYRNSFAALSHWHAALAVLFLEPKVLFGESSLGSYSARRRISPKSPSLHACAWRSARPYRLSPTSTCANEPQAPVAA